VECADTLHYKRLKINLPFPNEFAKNVSKGIPYLKKLAYINEEKRFHFFKNFVTIKVATILSIKNLRIYLYNINNLNPLYQKPLSEVLLKFRTP